jgi:dihydroorotase-like cyclic amidohydrolase
MDSGPSNATFAHCPFGDAMTALIIRGGTVVNHDYSRRADVLVDGDTIVAIGSTVDAPAGAQVIDAGAAM